MRSLLTGVVMLASLATPPAVFAQANQQAQLRLTVIDQSGASIPGAQISIIRRDVEPLAVIADQRGQATVNALPVGPLKLHVEFGGFNSFDGDVTLRRGANNQTITLTVAGLQ